MVASRINHPSRNGHAPRPTANGRAQSGRKRRVSRATPAPPRAAGNGCPAPSQTGANGDGRDPKTGRFGAGNKCGKGNPFARRLGAMRTAFLDALTAEDVQALARRLLRQALAGDTAAAQLVLSYILGKPTAAVDPDALDLAEWQLLARSPSRAEMALTAIDAVPPALAVEMAGGAMPKGRTDTQVRDATTVENVISLSRHRHHGKKV
jgi:hypothetical protein